MAYLIFTMSLFQDCFDSQACDTGLVTKGKGLLRVYVKKGQLVSAILNGFIYYVFLTD